MLYDQKRRDHSAINGSNGLYACDMKANKRARKNAAAAASAAAEATTRPAGADTFWTSCDRCRMQYEYLRIYLNHNLLCPNCHHAFMAVETGLPCNGTSTSFTWTTKTQQQKNHTTVDHSYQSASRTSSIPGTGHGAYQQENTYESYNNQTFQFNQYPKTTGAAAANGYGTEALEKSKRKHEENYIYNYFSNGNEYPLGRGRHFKRRRNYNNGYAYASVDCEGENVAAAAGMTVIADAGRVNGTSGEKFRSAVSGRKANVLREIFQLDTRALLIQKAKAAICEKLQGLNISSSSQFSEKRKADRREKHVENDIKANGILSDNPVNKCKKYSSKDVDVKIPAADELNPELKRVPVSIDVPDPDFHDFDKERTERAFGNDQVWATYDSEDGMPRLYAMVQKVISMKPFRIRMSFLNSKSNSELAPINWIASGFTKTCGDFRVGRYQITETVNIFSHRVSWSKGPRGIIRIIPKKGDTWAVYQNWSSDWNELTPDDVIYKYEIVEVVDDFTEEQGVNVIPLLKVAGFKSVFHTGPDVRRIPKEELFRFSHRVPSRLLTGEEKNNAPKGCYELDPAATPVDLLKIIADVNEDTAQGSSD
ncbi:unnamed protein product [Urochloa humidicola]